MQASAGKAAEPSSKDAIQGGVERAVDDLYAAGNSLLKGDLANIWWRLDDYVLPVIAVLVILFVAYFIAAFLGRVISTPIRQRVDETLGRFIGRLVYYVIMLCAVLGVLGRFGISVTSFAAVIAAAGFAIGMAFQGTLSNFASGILLLVFRPFKVGDVVGAAGVTATVYEVDLFTTTFDTFDNRRFIIPNSLITGAIIENVSHHSERRVEVEVGCDYAASLDKTRDALTAAAESLKDRMVEGEGRGYQIVLQKLGDSAVQWSVRFWTKSDEFLSVKQALMEAVKNHLDDAGIGIPFPQMDVHLSQPAE